MEGKTFTGHTNWLVLGESARVDVDEQSEVACVDGGMEETEDIEKEDRENASAFVRALTTEAAWRRVFEVVRWKVENASSGEDGTWVERVSGGGARMDSGSKSLSAGERIFLTRR